MNRFQYYSVFFALICSSLTSCTDVVSKNDAEYKNMMATMQDLKIKVNLLQPGKVGPAGPDVSEKIQKISSKYNTTMKKFSDAVNKAYDDRNQATSTEEKVKNLVTELHNASQNNLMDET
ncbi:hypothetical protein [Candidatus Liberibacter sp.]|uniref:hypothetical protein n=1 Tax=Candidatus Liberibacter sp. TaxID=34022 RepID=UPI0015F55823|nr:hypothetical protein [Candidatus Liberibacter sp.]MBA5724312.1 hypothetical protein [Candidatus Liberibacter sp.]